MENFILHCLREYRITGFFFVHLEQNSVQKKLRYFPKLSSNFLQNSDFRKSTICKMNFLLHMKMTHYKKTQFKRRNSAKMLQNSDIFRSKLSFSEILCMLVVQSKSGPKKGLHILIISCSSTLYVGVSLPQVQGFEEGAQRHGGS